MSKVIVFARRFNAEAILLLILGGDCFADARNDDVARFMHSGISLEIGY